MKRATDILGTTGNIGSISIHALVKRATCKIYCMESIILHFNPRPREEGDFGDIRYPKFD